MEEEEGVMEVLRALVTNPEMIECPSTAWAKVYVSKSEMSVDGEVKKDGWRRYDRKYTNALRRGGWPLHNVDVDEGVVVTSVLVAAGTPNAIRNPADPTGKHYLVFEYDTEVHTHRFVRIDFHDPSLAGVAGVAESKEEKEEGEEGEDEREETSIEEVGLGSVVPRGVLGVISADDPYVLLHKVIPGDFQVSRVFPYSLVTPLVRMDPSDMPPGEIELWPNAPEEMSSVHRRVVAAFALHMFLASMTLEPESGKPPTDEGRVRVRRVIAVWNRGLDERFRLAESEYRQQYAVQYPSATLTRLEMKYLFHGTDSKAAPEIARLGFKGRMCTRHLYGYGIYAARNASYSDDYAKPDEAGVKSVFLCKALTVGCGRGHKTTFQSGLAGNAPTWLAATDSRRAVLSNCASDSDTPFHRYLYVFAQDADIVPLFRFEYQVLP